MPHAPMPHVMSRREWVQPVAPVLAEPSHANLYERAAGLLPMGAWSCDLTTEELTWTTGVFELFGFPCSTRIERREAVALYGEESRELLERLRAEAIDSCGVFSMDAQIVRADGEERWMRLTGATRASNGRAVELYGMKQDITADRARWAKLRRLADSDTLTGLVNRARFEAEFLNCAPGKSILAPLGALLLIDLKNTTVSPILGAAKGSDGWLSTFGQRLTSAFPDASMIARIGETQFALILPRSRSKIALGALSYNRAARLLRPVEWQGRTITIDASVGMAFADDPALFDPETMYASAKAALLKSDRLDRDLLRYTVAPTI